MIKNVGVIGVGGVGGYFGGKLCSDSGLNVYFVARGEHLAEIRKSGLILSTTEEQERVCTPCAAADARLVPALRKIV